MSGFNLKLALGFMYILYINNIADEYIHDFLVHKPDSYVAKKDWPAWPVSVRLILAKLKTVWFDVEKMTTSLLRLYIFKYVKLPDFYGRNILK